MRHEALANRHLTKSKPLTVHTSRNLVVALDSACQHATCKAGGELLGLTLSFLDLQLTQARSIRLPTRFR